MKKTDTNKLLITCLIVFPVLSANTAFADFSGEVVSVKDGDTLEVMQQPRQSSIAAENASIRRSMAFHKSPIYPIDEDDQSPPLLVIRVRLHGIDYPEKKQPFGQRAKQFVSDLAFGKTVKVIEKDRDRYGRTVGEIILDDGRNLNQELVRAGLAWWYRQYAPNDVELATLEKEARAMRAGLWIDANPVPPWEWRKKAAK